MTDPYVAIDLEWRPTYSRGATSRVALMQLASPRIAVLIRVCRMGFKLHRQLRAFLGDSGICLVGFHWDGADEAQMQVSVLQGHNCMNQCSD